MNTIASINDNAMCKFMDKLYEGKSYKSCLAIIDNSNIDMLERILIAAPRYLQMNFKTFKPYVNINDDETEDRPDWTSLFHYSYEQIKKGRTDINREIMEYLLHPTKVQKWIEAGNEVEEYLP